MSQQWTADWTNFNPQVTDYRARTVKPVVVLGPGLNSGRTPYYQTWNRTLRRQILRTC